MTTKTKTKKATAAPEAPIFPSHARIERHELIAVDTHKAFSYDKSTGFWSWYDRDEPETLYGVFNSRLEALIDAVEPYTEGGAE